MASHFSSRSITWSFQSPNFRYFWASEFFNNIGDQMSLVVLAWFVLVETNSPFMLGLFGALRFFGSLVAPLFGVAADRYDRRLLLFMIRTASAAFAAALLALSATGALEVWHAIFLSSLWGITRTFGEVTREAMTADLVEPQRLATAVSLIRTCQSASQMVGPLVGGILLDRNGLTAAYVPIVAAHVASCFLVLLIHGIPKGVNIAGSSVLQNLVEAASYIRRDNVVLGLLLMAFLVNFTTLTLIGGMMAVYARDVLNTGPVGLAALLWAFATGAFVGSLGLAGWRPIRRRGRFLIVTALVWHIWLLALSQSNWLGLSLPILLVYGGFSSFTMVTMATMLIGITAPEYRGRVMGVRSLAVYGLPLGLLASGALIGTMGVPMTFSLAAALGAVVIVFIVLRLRKLWLAT